MLSPETEKEIYENLDAVWAKLPQGDARELFLQLMWTTCSRHVIPVLIRWNNDRIPKTPRYRKDPESVESNMNDIVYGSRVDVEVAKGDIRVGIFRNYSGKGDGAWVDFPDFPELSDFYSMSAIELADESEADTANARLAAETERAIRNHPNNKD